MKLTSSHSLPARGAFTLLEILIATVCFAIVLAAINGVFYSGIRLRNRSAAALEKSQPLTQALALHADGQADKARQSIASAKRHAANAPGDTGDLMARIEQAARRLDEPPPP